MAQHPSPHPHPPTPFLAPSPRRDPNYEIPLDISMHIFNCNKTVEAIILKCL